MTGSVRTPAHRRKLGLSAVALTKARNPKNLVEILTGVRNELEEQMEAAGFLAGAPFSWITVIVRLGLKYSSQPVYGKINRKHGDLPVSIEIDTADVLDVSDDEIREVLRVSIRRTLDDVGLRYDRPGLAKRAK